MLVAGYLWNMGFSIGGACAMLVLQEQDSCVALILFHMVLA